MSSSVTLTFSLNTGFDALTPGDTTTIVIPPRAGGVKPKASTSIERTHSQTETIASLLSFFNSAITEAVYAPGQNGPYWCSVLAADTLALMSTWDGWPASLSATTTDPALQIG